eukprot:CAMPEP_0119125642 /NCGR_PEP_ID=MMETSP1310-20130426/4846_1 /TAXON_ID=464262 /ORGANISM="Genus nov. species nov., Strain RCC2339" /LENGTH=382 /DNA_ID=CAMNT_0007115729 /DNA_START=30 /DNA_END=1174 /DNA_ORIENTATION=-
MAPGGNQPIYKIKHAKKGKTNYDAVERTGIMDPNITPSLPVIDQWVKVLRAAWTPEVQDLWRRLTMAERRKMVMGANPTFPEREKDINNPILAGMSVQNLQRCLDELIGELLPPEDLEKEWRAERMEEEERKGQGTKGKNQKGSPDASGAGGEKKDSQDGDDAANDSGRLYEAEYAMDYTINFVRVLLSVGALPKLGVQQLWCWLESSRNGFYNVKDMKKVQKGKMDGMLVGDEVQYVILRLRMTYQTALTIVLDLRDTYGMPRVFRPGCTYCGASLRKRQTCAKCLQAFYCGRDCQVAHWKDVHKSECFSMDDLNRILRTLPRRLVVDPKWNPKTYDNSPPPKDVSPVGALLLRVPILAATKFNKADAETWRRAQLYFNHV